MPDHWIISASPLSRAAYDQSQVASETDGEGFDSIDVTANSLNDLRQSPDSFGTESGTVGDETGTIPVDLRAVVSAWPTLSVDDRKVVLAIVREAATRAQ